MASSSAHRHRVVVAGGGVAGLEALLALHQLAGEYVDLTLVEPSDSFVLRALSVQDPFAPAPPQRYALARICAEHGIRHVRDRLDRVDVERRVARTAAGDEQPYDSLLLALGARPASVYPQATTFSGTPDAKAMQDLLRAVERGEASTIAFVVPPRTTWSLPLYELALMTAQRVRALGLDGVELTLVTPEEAPLHVFGAEASAAVAAELADAGVEVVSGGYTEAVVDGIVSVHCAGGQRELVADRVVALPRLEGTAPPSVPADPEGFLRIGQDGGVRDVADVFAAGDGTDFPIKQGGIAAQQAEAAAHAIAGRAGVDVEPAPFRPVLRGRLLTGGGSRFLRRRLTGGEGETSAASAEALWWPASKVAAPRLARYLDRLDHEDDGFAAPGEPDRERGEIEVLGRHTPAPRLGTSGPGGVHRGITAHEVPRERWRAYLQAITSERADSRTVIEVHGAELGAQTEERGMLLRELAYDARGDVIEVAVSRPRPGGEDVLRHVVDHPARLFVDSSEGILPRAIAVEDADGTRTLVQLVDDAAFGG